MNGLTDMKVWLLPSVQNGKELRLSTRVNMESSTGVLDFDVLRRGFESQTKQRYMIMQGHPPYWDAASKATFPKIVDYLISKKTRFMTPYQYYQSLPH